MLSHLSLVTRSWFAPEFAFLTLVVHPLFWHKLRLLIILNYLSETGTFFLCVLASIPIHRMNPISILANRIFYFISVLVKSHSVIAFLHLEWCHHVFLCHEFIVFLVIHFIDKFLFSVVVIDSLDGSLLFFFQFDDSSFYIYLFLLDLFEGIYGFVHIIGRLQ